MWCECRYAEAFPEEDGFRRPETLSEETLGSGLWNAAWVRSLFPHTLLFLDYVIKYAVKFIVS